MMTINNRTQYSSSYQHQQAECRSKSTVGHVQTYDKISDHSLTDSEASV